MSNLILTRLLSALRFPSRAEGSAASPDAQSTLQQMHRCCSHWLLGYWMPASAWKDVTASSSLSLVGFGGLSVVCDRRKAMNAELIERISPPATLRNHASEHRGRDAATAR